MKYLMNGKSLNLNTEKCIGCGMCVNVCPHDVYKIENKKAKIHNKDACMECGACKMNCPANAINVKVGVGCAAAIIYGMITRKPPQCGCSGNGKKSGCC